MYFNERFGVSAIKMRALSVFNPETGVDNKVFVDPKLLTDAKEEFAGSHSELLDYFAGTVAIIKMIKKKEDSDMAWVAAWRRMEFKETSNTGIGHSKEGTRGNGIGEILAKRIVGRASDLLPFVGYEPDMFELVGVFADGIGCDRLSDMIVAILKARFIEYTDRVTRSLGILRVLPIKFGPRQFLLPRFKVGEDPTILLPQELLKPLPIALDIEGALINADLNEEARKAVNKLFSTAYQSGISPEKSELRNFIWSNKSLFNGILSGYRQAKSSRYDFDTDPLEVSGYDSIARELIGTPSVNMVGLDDWGRVVGCVTNTLLHLRQSIEENKLSEVLYDDAGKPRKEAISQRIIYAIAAIFGNLYNVDVSQQGNAGPGAVDFRFTVGSKSRLLLELKLSTHARLRDGYYEQLPAYGRAEGIKKLILVIIQVSADDAHLDALKRSITLKSLPIQVVVIDAVPKPSASKRTAS